MFERPSRIESARATDEAEAGMVKAVISEETGQIEYIPQNEAGVDRIEQTKNPREPGNLDAKEHRSLRRVLMALGIVLSVSASEKERDGYEDTTAALDLEKHTTSAAAKSVPLEPMTKPGLREAVEEALGGAKQSLEEGVTRPQERQFDSEVVTQTVQGWLETYPQQESPFYERRAEALAQEKTMKRTEAMFITEDGTVLQGPTALTDAAGYTPEDMTVSYQGGDPVGIPGAWSKPIKERLSEEYGIAVDDIEMRHVYLELQHSPEVETQEELVEQRIRAVEAEEGMSLTELIDTHFEFAPNNLAHQPAERLYLEQRLKEMLPALIAKESLFSKSAVSDKGAYGYMQIMPDAWERHADEGMSQNSLRDALVVAGRYFSAAYDYFTNNMSEQLKDIETNYFSGDHMAMVEHFLLKVLQNDYNAGNGNMRKVLGWFETHYQEPHELAQAYGAGTELQNKDIYFALSQLAAVADTGSAYKTYAANYTIEIAGLEKVFEKIDKQYAPELLASNQ